MKINKAQFEEALIAAFELTDEQLRAAAKSGQSRSYYVAFRRRTFPLKAVLRLAYKRQGLKWDGPQSAKAARNLRDDFNILHITQNTETKRLERQRRSVERWERDGRFRTDVLDLYRAACVVSGCSAPDALDAAHLLGVGKAGEDKPENGIVFRADLHRLFDAKPAQMSICPKSMTVQFSEECREHYSAYDGREIEIPPGGPLPAAFAEHWKAFKKTQRKSAKG